MATCFIVDFQEHVFMQVHNVHLSGANSAGTRKVYVCNLCKDMFLEVQNETCIEIWCLFWYIALMVFIYVIWGSLFNFRHLDPQVRGREDLRALCWHHFAGLGGPGGLCGWIPKSSCSVVKQWILQHVHTRCFIEQKWRNVTPPIYNYRFSRWIATSLIYNRK